MILLTGATGLIGRYIALELLSRGVSFKALRRKESIIPELLDKHKQSDLITWLDGDLRDYLSLSTAFEDITEVIHCAALVSYYKGDYSDMWEINVQGTINMLNIAIEKDIKRFVHMSSVAALGKSDHRGSIDENAQWYKSSQNSYYAETKYAAELEVWRSSEEGLPVLIINPSTVIGPFTWGKGSTQFFKYVWNERKFYPKGYVNYIDVRDVVQLVFKLMNSGVTGERFILNGGKTTFRYFFKLIARHFNKKVPSREFKNWMVGVFTFAEKLRSIFTGEKAVITRETALLTALNIDYSTTKIKSFLDFEFKPLEDTIVWTCSELIKLRS